MNSESNPKPGQGGLLENLVESPAANAAIDIREEAIRYTDWGFHVFPLRSWLATPNGPMCDCVGCDKPGKHPRFAADDDNPAPWGASDRASIVGPMFSNPNDGIGVACGPSGIVGFDIDGEQGLESWASLIGNHEIETLESSTGRGRHVYFRASDIRSMNSAWPGLDVKGIGGYLVLPPTKHKSGNRYAWLNDHDIAPLPEFLRETLESKGLVGARERVVIPFGGRPATESEKRSARGILGHYRVLIEEREFPGPVYALLNQAALVLGKFAPHCLSESEIESELIDALRAKDPGDRYLEKNIRVIRNGLADGQKQREYPRQEPTALAKAPAVEVLSPRGDTSPVKTVARVVKGLGKHSKEGKYLDKVLVKGEPSYYHENNPEGVAIRAEAARILCNRAPRANVEALVALAAQADEEAFGLEIRKAYGLLETWRLEVLTTVKGDVKPCTANAIYILRSQIDLVGLFAHDTFAGETYYTRNAPWGAKEGTAVTDPQVTTATSYIARLDVTGVGFEPKMLHGAIEAVAHENSYDPLRDYLDSLVWDGVKRIDKWLTTYAGVEPSEYVTAVGRCWLISAAARGLHPGCKADHVLVLEGKGGIGKSSLLAALAGDWFTDKLGNLDGKDAAENLQSKWIVEIAELVALRGRDSEVTKSFLTRTADRYRSAYGYRAGDRLRRCVFAGTTNDQHYLEDLTGNRRYWPVRASRCDVEGIARDRDQIWAEAVAAFRRGEQWWLTPEQEALASDEQAARDVTDPWAELIADLPPERTELSMTEALSICGVPTAQQTPAAGRRCGKVLRALGWSRRLDSTSRRKIWTRA